MNSASSPIANVTDRMASIEARFGTRPPVSAAALAAMTSGGSGRSRDANASFGQLFDRLVSSSTTTDPGDTGAALENVLEQVLATQGTDPVSTRGAITTVEESTSPVALAADAADGERIVDLAAKHLGVPYVWGGEDPSGFDCSGLVQYVYAKLGIDLPRVSRDQARVGQEVPSLDQALPGDLVAFGTPVDHIGIYAGNGQMVVAPKTGDVVKFQQIRREPVTIRRVLDVTSAGVASTPAAGLQTQADQPYLALFTEAESRHGVSAELLQAVAKQESGFNPNAVSPAGAQGLMQLMPATAKALGVDPFNPTAAVDGSARLLSQHLRRFGSVPLALAAYNAGPGAVEKFGGIPPYKETQGYVRKIMADLADSPATATFSRSGASPQPLTQQLVDQPSQIRRATPLFSDGAVANAGTMTRPVVPARTALSSAPTLIPSALTTAPVASSAATSVAAPAPAPVSAPVAVVVVPPATTTLPISSVPSPSMVPATVIGTPGFTLPEGTPVSPVRGAWGPNTQTQVTSVGGSNTTSWLESGLLDPASPADIAAIVSSAKGPVAKGVLKILQNATAAQLISPEFRQTLNDVNRDALGLPDAPDVIPVQPPAPAATAPAPSTVLPAPAPASAAPSPTLARPIVPTTTSK